MFKKNTIILPLFLIVLLGTACGFLDRGKPDMNKIFADMEKGIMNTEEDRFKKHWTPESYAKDLVGEGLSGERFYKQASRKKFFPNPDFGGKETVGKVEIVPTKLYAWEKEREVDEIFFAIADGKVLGGGEEKENVKKLAERFNKGDFLKPE